jgi:DNA-directed RNA polymerase subunit RPC12/RpoP
MTSFHCVDCGAYFSVSPDQREDVRVCPCCSATVIQRHRLTETVTLR